MHIFYCAGGNLGEVVVSDVGVCSIGRCTCASGVLSVSGASEQCASDAQRQT